MVSVLCVTDDKAHYYPDAGTFVTKLIAVTIQPRSISSPVSSKNLVAGRIPAAKITISAGNAPALVCTCSTVGAQPAAPPVDGVELPGVFTVRTPEDAIGARKYAKEHLSLQPSYLSSCCVAVDMAAKTVSVRGDRMETVSYDKLVYLQSIPPPFQSRRQCSTANRIPHKKYPSPSYK